MADGASVLQPGEAEVRNELHWDRPALFTRALIAIVLSGIVAVAFALRLVLLLPQAQAPFFHGISPIFGTWGYYLAAHGRWDMVEGGINVAMYQRGLDENRLVDPAEVLADGIDDAPAAQGTYTAEQPGQGVFVGLIWLLTRDYRYIYVLIAQAAIDALFCVVAYFVAARVWGSLGGLFGAAGYALFLPQAVLAAYPMYNFWSGPLLLLQVANFLYFPRDAKHLTLHAAAAGAIVGVGTMFTPTFLPLLAAPWLIVVWKRGLRLALGWTVVGAVVATIVLIPWSIRAHTIHGSYRPMANAYWYNTYYSLVEQKDSPFGPESSFGWPRSDDPTYYWARDTFGITSWHSAESEVLMRSLVLQAMRHDPLYFPQVVVSRFVSVLIMSSRAADQSAWALNAVQCYHLAAAPSTSAPPPPGVCDPRYTSLNPWPVQSAVIIHWLYWLNHPWSVNIGELPRYAMVDEGVLGLPLLAVAGIVIGLRRDPAVAGTLALTVLAWSGVYSMHHIEPRYVAGSQALMAIAACGGIGYALEYFVRLLSRRSEREVSMSSIGGQISPESAAQ